MKLMIKLLSCLFCLLLTQAYAYTPQSEYITLNPLDVQRFSTVIAQIKKLYVEPIQDDKLFSGAIQGMLDSLDPHSSYLDMETYKSLKEQSYGNFVGLGIELTQEKGVIKVLSPIDDTPAAKAGIKPGDYILAINGKPLINVPLLKAIQKMRGKKGTKITLTVVNKQARKPRKVTMVRDVIHVNSVKSKMLNDHYGYIRITHFQIETGEKLLAAIKKLKKHAKGSLHGLVLDLRNNPGGILDSSVEVADAFLDSQKLRNNQLIVYTKGRESSSEIEKTATKGDILKGAPLIVLINQGSASASEIVAGALQDHKRAIIMGKKSFGKGSVQTVFPIDDETAIKLTTALYYTPKGKSIQAEGITPDILVDTLKFQKPDKENAIFLFNLRESDLKGHLENGNTGHSSTQHKIKDNEQLQNIAKKDYQLYEAIRLLKSMHLLQQRKDT